MISAQIDELRELAGDGSMEWVTCPIRASVLRDAADTIWELRDDLQRANAENRKLREQLERVQPTDCEGNVLDIADTVHMLRSEYDGDHEWEDVVTELVLTKWGGDRWIVRGSKGEAWACDCTKTGYDEDAYEASDDVEPFGEPTLLEVENAKLRKLVAKYSAAAKYLCGHSHCNECNLDCASFFDDVPSGWDCARMLLDKRARELGVGVPE